MSKSSIFPVLFTLLCTGACYAQSAPKLSGQPLVLLDSYFNNEIKKDPNGTPQSWHYKWEENSGVGFSLFAGVLKDKGFTTETLRAAPTKANLKHASVYIIVDPDIEKENPTPSFINEQDISAITSWLKAGGVLLLMANDTGNAELAHLNQLAKHFGIQFNLNSKGRVTKNEFEMGRVDIFPENQFFKTARQLFIKEYSTLTLTDAAKSVLKDKDGDQVIAIAKYGKGAVFAIGDPWLYNEYVDGKKLPLAFDNLNAARDLADWIKSCL
jgi:unsaturated rhamnogalacturonyl hydrolase